MLFTSKTTPGAIDARITGWQRGRSAKERRGRAVSEALLVADAQTPRKLRGKTRLDIGLEEVERIDVWVELDEAEAN